MSGPEGNNDRGEEWAPVREHTASDWKGYPIDNRYKVFTGGKHTIGSSTWRTGEIAERYWNGGGIYMSPEDPAYVYLHELGHAVNGHAGSTEPRERIEHELAAEKFALEKYIDWEGAELSYLEGRQRDFLENNFDEEDKPDLLLKEECKPVIDEMFENARTKLAKR